MSSATTKRPTAESTATIQAQQQAICMELPLPLRLIFEEQCDGIVANNYVNSDDEEEMTAPLSTSSRLFKRRVLRLQNGCTLPRIERAGGSEPFSRELLELRSSLSEVSLHSNRYNPNIEELVNQY
jgi:hypothetical protein